MVYLYINISHGSPLRLCMVTWSGSAPGVSIAFAEWDRPFQTWGMLLLHTTFVPRSFSKAEICIGTDPSSLVI